MTDLFNYDTSWLNPGLKLLVVVLFLFVSVIYARSRRFYAGELHAVLSIFFWMAAIGALAAVLRHFGHGTEFGFTKEFSLKWFQSLAYLVQAVLFAIGAWMLSKGIIPELRD
jgi:hypothetical protein